MRIEYLLFVIYLALSFWIIPKISFIRHSDLTARETRLLLAFKMLSGIAGAFYFDKISGYQDYRIFNEEGLLQYELLLSNPMLFFTDFSNDFQSYGLGGLFDSTDSFWAYLRFNLVYKFIALLNLITHGNFYFNTVLFCSIVFFGHIAFYRIFSEIYNGQKLKILFACFLLPSLLLYTSCVHKDGIIFLSIGVISYISYRLLSSPHSLNIKYMVFLLMGMMSVFLFRNYVIAAIVPAMLVAVFYKVLPHRKRLIFPIAYSFFFLLFFLSGFSKSSFNMPAAVVQRKADFVALGEAKTNIIMNELYPTVQSFVLNFPQAANHYFFRPYLWEFPQLSVILAALELFACQLGILAFVFYRKKSSMPIQPFNVFGLCFLFNMMLIIGYTIPNIGAIVRYRSIFWVFLICPLLCNTDWKKIFSFRKTRHK